MSRAAGLADRLSLIVITDRECGAGRSLLDVVRAALQAGAPAIQLRDKAADARTLLELASSLLVETRRTGSLLFVNDRLDVALAAAADGAHLGGDDLPLAAARRIAPEGFLLGQSVDDPGEAAAAEAAGADYVGVGPVFSTSSKPDAGAPLGTDGVAEVARSVRVPVVAIGGVDAISAREASRGGAAGVAVIRAVMAATDPGLATRDLLAAVREGISARPPIR